MYKIYKPLSERLESHERVKHHTNILKIIVITKLWIGAEYGQTP